MYRKISGGRKKSHHAKKHHHTTRRRRRSIGAGSDIGGIATKVGGLVVGASAARELNTLLVKFFPSLANSPMISGLIQIGAGLVLPKFVKGNFVSFVADGMIANGGMVAIVSTGVIKGVNKMSYQINGTANLPVVNGTANLKVINGAQTRISSIPVPMAKVQTFATHV